MANTKFEIAPRRSVAFFALLAMVMVLASYVVLVLLAAACVYLPFILLTLAHTMQLQLFLLFLGGVAVAGAVLWSLVPRRDKFTAPGLLLARLDQLKLFHEIDEIATALNETVPGEVYLIGQPNAFVADRGGILGYGSRRVMGIGLPLLSTLSISEFRAVLAHEFAHFYSGDTSLGPWVYKTQSALIRTFQNIGQLQKVGRVGIMQVLFAVVTILLKWYFLFFLRVIQLVSRQQEFRSDELACLVAGKHALMSGLEKIHGAAIMWPTYWGSEVAPVLDLNCIPDIADGFTQFLAAPEIAEVVNTCIQKERESGETRPYDTHPPLGKRVAAMERLNTPDFPPDVLPAVSLLDEPRAAELRWLEQMNPTLPKGSLRHVGWDEVGTSVTIPLWRSNVMSYGALLSGAKAADLPDLLERLGEIASRLPDPKGRLLTRAECKTRTASLIGMALSLALIEQGWKLEAQPATLHLRRGEEVLDAFTLVNEILAGKISREEWMKKAKELGIAGKPLGVIQNNSTSGTSA